MKKIAKYILTALLAVTLVSCNESFLEFSPKDRITDDSYWKTESDFFAAIVGAYCELLERNNNAMGMVVYSSDIPTFEGVFTSGPTVLENRFLPTTGSFYWDYCYFIISKTNLILANIDKSDMSQALKDRYRGEASFLRGYAYYNLARNYGGVPLVLKPVAADASSDMPKASKNDTWAQVIADFSVAEQNLPLQWDNINAGRATKGAAIAYKGIAQMWTGDWAKAKTTMESVFALNLYGLEETYRKAFSYSAENGKERLFEVQFRSDNRNTGWGRSLGGQILGHFDAPRGVGNNLAPWGGWSEAAISENLGKSFEPGDQRRTACLVSVGETYKGEDMAPGDAYTMKAGDNLTGYCCTKYWYGPLLNGAYALGINIPLLRYSEILLHYAEILNELGKASEAYTYINQVRARAGLNPLPASGDKVACLNAITKERRHEIYHETNFYYDLVRTNKIKEHLQTNYNVTYKDHWKLYPIPQSEIDKNKALVQNDGY